MAAMTTAELRGYHQICGPNGAMMVIAAPRTLGELRKHYHKALQAVLSGELAKDLAGHPLADIEAAVTAA